MKNNNTFMNMNALSSDQPGIHCFFFAQDGGQIFFADPFSIRLYDCLLVYKILRCTIHEGNQLLMKKPYSVSCRLDLFMLFISNRFKLNDHDLIRFAKDINLNCLLMFL